MTGDKIVKGSGKSGFGKIIMELRLELDTKLETAAKRITRARTRKNLVGSGAGK